MTAALFENKQFYWDMENMLPKKKKKTFVRILILCLLRLFDGNEEKKNVS